jgi:hypothetical protein
MQYCFSVRENKVLNFNAVGIKVYQLYEVESPSTEICHLLYVGCCEDTA